MAFSLVRYSQQDPRWKETPLGSGPDTIGYFGCALTSVAMLSSGWGFSETPATLNQKLKANGGFVHEAVVWAGISAIYPALQSTGLTLCNNPPAPISQINSALTSGQPVVAEVDFSPAAGLQTHWVVLYAPFGSDYLILDPWPYPSDSGQVTLMSRFSHGRPLTSAIKAVAWYQCSLGAPAPGPAPVPTDLYVRAIASATAGLRVHPQPALNSPANYAEMPGVPLQVIEEKAGALTKIGHQDEWIHIRDPQGHTGYVAAWYIEQVPAAPTVPPAPSPQPIPEPAPAPSPNPTPGPSGEPIRFQVVVLRSVGAGGLVVRQQPAKAAERVNIEKAGARLTVLEPASTGLSKIGVVGQWLSVKATNNRIGYVAAQYVQLRS